MICYLSMSGNIKKSWLAIAQCEDYFLPDGNYGPQCSNRKNISFQNNLPELQKEIPRRTFEILFQHMCLHHKQTPCGSINFMSH